MPARSPSPFGTAAAAASVAAGTHALRPRRRAAARRPGRRGCQVGGWLLTLAASALPAVAQPPGATPASAGAPAVTVPVAPGAAAVGCTPGEAVAAFEHRGVALLLPPGFCGPAATLTAAAELFVFRKLLPGDDRRATTITLTVMPQQPGLALDSWERREQQDRQLRLHLETLAGRRGDFATEPTRRLRLGDALAASQRWRGTQEGEPLAGAMTVLVRTADRVLFAVQGFPATGAADLAAAVDAVERAVVGAR